MTRHDRGPAIYNVRISLYPEHIIVIEDLALKYNYLDEFNIKDPKTRQMIPTLIRDIIISHRAIENSDYPKILDIIYENREEFEEMIKEKKRKDE